MPRKEDINPETGLPYAVNPRTGVWDDTYWAEVAEPQLRGQYQNTPEGLISTVVDEYQKQLDEYSKRTKEFDEKNPFSFDDMLSQEKTRTAQRLDPYYNQTLSDYLRSVETRRSRSVEDERNVLSELQAETESYTGKARENVDLALERSREGFADVGLLSSGKALRAQGLIEKEGQETMSDFLRRQGTVEQRAKLAGRRTTEDIEFERGQKERDIARERSYQTESQSLSETLRKQGQREFEKSQYLGIPPGVNPLTYQNYSFNLLS